jgi:opacity protein-like surface antigen
MKLISKTLLVLGLFLLPFTTIYAQKFKAGIIIGMNGSQINGDNMAGFNKGGFLGGIYVDYPFNKSWSGGFEMDFTMKGSKRTYSDSNGVATAGPGSWDDLELGYLEVPIFAKYHFNKHFEVYFGPAFGLLMYSTWYPGQGSIGNQGGEAKADFLRSYDISFTGGVTYNFAEHFSATVRYSNSLISIGTGSYNSLLSNSPINNGLTNIVISGALVYHFWPQNLKN